MRRLTRQFRGNRNLLISSRTLSIFFSSIFFLLVFICTSLWAQETSVLNKFEYRTDNGLISNNVFSVVFDDSANSVWFGTDKGVSRYDGTWTSFASESDATKDTSEDALFPPGEVRVLEYAETDGSLWAATNLGYVATWDHVEQQWNTVLEPADVTTAGAIHSLFVDAPTLWIGTDSGLLIYDLSDESLSGTLSPVDLACEELTSTNLEGETPHAVYAIARNRNVVWFGTEQGLFFQIDNSCWRREQTKIGSEDNPSINSLLWLDHTLDEVDNPVLWIGTKGAIARFDPDAASDERWEITDIGEFKSGNFVPKPVKNLSVGTADDLWIATDGIGAINLSFDGANVSAIGYNNTISNRRVNVSVRDIAFDSDGAIWFATPIGATQYLNSDLWSTYEFSASRLTIPITSTNNISGTSPAMALETELMFDALQPNLDDIRDLLVSGSDNLLWIASGGGIRSRDASNKRGNNYPEELFLGTRYVEAEGQEFRNAVLPENPTTSLAQDSRGVIWAGFNDRGIAAYTGGIWNDTSAPRPTGTWIVPPWLDGLPSLAINDLLVLNSQLWIGAESVDPAVSALAYVELSSSLGDRLETVDDFTGLGSVLSMAADSTGRLWVATAAGIHMSQQSPSDNIDVAWTLNTFAEITQIDGAPSKRTIRLAADSKEAGAMWLIIPDYGLFRWNNFTWSNADPDDNLPTKDLRTLFSDMQTGDLWIGSAAGVTRYDGRSWETFSSVDGLVDDGIDAIARTPVGPYWFGGDKSGFSVYDPTDITPPWIQVGRIEGNSEISFFDDSGEWATEQTYREGYTLKVIEGSTLPLFLEFGDLQTPREQLQVYYRTLSTPSPSLPTDCLIDSEDSSQVGAWLRYSGQFTWPASAVGEYQVEFCARDQAFNYSLIKSLRVFVTESNTFDLSRIGLPARVERSTLLTLTLLSAIALLAFGYVGTDKLRKRRRSVEAVQRGYNPYVSGEPVRSEDMFFGRQGLLQRIVDTLHNNSIMIHGERRIGKTTMLYQLSNTLDDVSDPEFWFVPIYIDLEGTPAEMFFHLLIEEIVNKALTLDGADTLLVPVFDMLSYHDIPGEAYTDRRFTRDLRSVIQALQKYGAVKHPNRILRVILLMDEMDVLSQYDHLIQQQLRRIFMRDFAATLGAVVAGIQISREWDRVESPWFNLFNEIEIEPFGRDEAVDLLVEPVKGYYIYESAALEMILNYSDGRPFRIQQYALEAVTHMLADKRRQIRVRDVETAHENIQNSGNISHTDAGLSVEKGTL